MKTFKHLYPQITAFANLYQAFKNAARGKRKKHDVAAFEYNLVFIGIPSALAPSPAMLANVSAINVNYFGRRLE
jgi:hypothetical protein